MTRRGVFAFLAIAAALWPLRGRSQSAGRTYRIGVLLPAGETASSRELIHALAELGYSEGRNTVFLVRAANLQPERLVDLARELVSERPDVIVSATERAASALTEATREIPIILALIGDPVALGLTRSIARPTGNVTGFTTGHDTVAAKRLELLLELVPATRRVAVLWTEQNSQHKLLLDRVRQAAAALKIELLSLPVTVDEDVSAALARAEQRAATALLVASDPLTIRNRRTIIDECAVRGLPAMHSYSFEVRDGALASYGSDVGEEYRRAAVYVDRILKGARVAELPFQEPTQISLALNLRTAKALGLTVPPDLLARASEIIE